MPLQKEELDRLIQVLRDALDCMSWPQDAAHIVTIQAMLDATDSELFGKLVQLYSSPLPTEVPVREELDTAIDPAIVMMETSFTSDHDHYEPTVTQSDQDCVVIENSSTTVSSSLPNDDQTCSNATVIQNQTYRDGDHFDQPAAQHTAPVDVLFPMRQKSVHAEIQKILLKKKPDQQ